MIRASLRFALAALLCSVAPLALAQQQSAQQRSRTATEPRQQSPAPTGAGSTQKPAAGAATQKPATAPAKTPAGQAKPGAGPAPGPGGAQATLLASFNDWNAYVSGQGRAKLCYALSQPKERLPKDLKRDPAYLFVSFRPAENVRNEIAVVMGFATKDGGAAEAVVGNAAFALVTKGPNAWVKNQSEEPKVIAAFSKGKDVTVKATSGRGNAVTDRYSLSGFAQALERARKECS